MREIFPNPFPFTCYACYELRKTPRHPFIHRHCCVATIFLKSTSNRLFFIVATRYYKIHSATSFLVWNPLYIGISVIVACSRKVYRHFFLFPHILVLFHWLATFSMAVHIALANIGIVPDIYISEVGLPFSPHFLSGFCLSDILHNRICLFNVIPSCWCSRLFPLQS